MAEFKRVFFYAQGDTDSVVLSNALRAFRDDLEGVEDLEWETTFAVGDYDVVVFKAWTGLEDEIELVPTKGTDWDSEVKKMTDFARTTPPHLRLV